MDSSNLMARKFNLILYAFIGVCIIKIGLSFFGRYLMQDIIQVHDKYVLIESEVTKFKYFNDSLAGNENFRRKLFDTLTHVDQLQQVKQEIGKQLERKIIEFDRQNHNRAVCSVIQREY